MLRPLSLLADHLTTDTLDHSAVAVSESYMILLLVIKFLIYTVPYSCVIKRIHLHISPQEENKRLTATNSEGILI